MAAKKVRLLFVCEGSTEKKAFPGCRNAAGEKVRTLHSYRFRAATQAEAKAGSEELQRYWIETPAGSLVIDGVVPQPFETGRVYAIEISATAELAD